MSELALRPIQPDDLPFVRSMLGEAAFWREGSRPDLSAALAEPTLAVYVEGWGRAGDAGLVAWVGDAAVGAVWTRTFTDDAHGYGFVDSRTPELSMAVVREFHRRGIGRALLTTMLAQSRLRGALRLSLSVETDNPAVHLYRQVGFQVLEEVGNAVTMIRSFE